MPRRPTRTTTTTKSPRSARVSNKEKVVIDEMRRVTRPRRKTRAAVPAVVEEPAPTRRPRRKRARAVDSRIVHLALSPGTANRLRAILARARWDNEPELDAIVKELNDQLTEMGMHL